MNLTQCARNSLTLILLCTALATVPCSQAADSNDRSKGTLTLLMENDVFAATDRHYTNGLQLSYLTAPRAPDGFAAKLFGWLPGNRDSEVRVGWQAGQSIFTPKDKDAFARLPDQRPYAAWLYAGMSLVYSNERHIDTLSLTLGTIGPDAKGEELQNNVHEWSDTT